MKNTYFIDTKKLSPTHSYLSKKNLSDTQKYFDTHEIDDYPPLQIMKCSSKYLLVGDHHIAYYLFLKGMPKVKVCSDDNKGHFFLNLELENGCIKENLFTIGSLEGRIISDKEYKTKWILPYEAKKSEFKQPSPSYFECQRITESKEKNALAYKILDATPPYFANEFIYKNYIEQVSDTHFISFSFLDYPIAFVACRHSKDNILEIYMLGICESIESLELSDRIMSEVGKLAKSLGKEYITVKIPAKTAVQNKAYKLYEYYINYGFTHIENLESPWDPNRLCMLLIKH